MVKTMVRRGGPHKFNWKRLIQGFHDYNGDVGGDGDDGEGEERRARQIKLEGIYSKDF